MLCANAVHVLPLAAVLALTANLAADCGPFFSPTVQFATSPSVPADLKVADLDSDGVQNVEPADSAIYECRIASGCDTKPVSAFLAVQAPANPCPVDFNTDGFLDFFDYADYVQAFEQGC